MSKSKKGKKPTAWKVPAEVLDRNKNYVVEINDQSNDFCEGDLAVIRYSENHSCWVDAIDGGNNLVHIEDIARYMELPD